MEKKKIIFALTIALIIGGAYYFVNSDKSGDNTDSQEIKQKQERLSEKKSDKSIKEDEISESSPQKKEKKQKKVESLKGQIEDSTYVKHSTIHKSAATGMIPLSAISELSDLPKEIQTKVNQLADNSTEIFMIKRHGDKLVVLTGNEDNIRHGIDFVEISIPTGHQSVSTFGYNGKIQDSQNDIWDYNENKLPTKHTKYNQDGDIEFVEIWNYEPDNPVKYEMKNAEGKVLSMRKETISDGENIRIEHLIYDTNGNTKANVTASYEGSEIKRFTYYNSENPSAGASVFSEYKDGEKVKETLYTPELKVQNVYEATYKNGEISGITVLDNKNQKLGTIQE